MRRGWDSNPRVQAPTVLQTEPIDHSGTSSIKKKPSLFSQTELGNVPINMNKKLYEFSLLAICLRRSANKTSARITAKNVSVFLAILLQLLGEFA